MKNNQARRLILAVTASVFLIIAIGSLIAPNVMASQLGYQLSNIDARNEFRAIYVGLWMATAVYFAIAYQRFSEALLGDLGALLILGQTVGRLISLALDGIPSTRMWIPFVVEAVGGIAILLIRPISPKNETK